MYCFMIVSPLSWACPASLFRISLLWPAGDPFFRRDGSFFLFCPIRSDCYYMLAFPPFQSVRNLNILPFRFRRGRLKRFSPPLRPPPFFPFYFEGTYFDSLSDFLPFQFFSNCLEKRKCRGTAYLLLLFSPFPFFFPPKHPSINSPSSLVAFLTTCKKLYIFFSFVV